MKTYKCTQTGGVLFECSQINEKRFVSTQINEKKIILSELTITRTTTDSTFTLADWTKYTADQTIKT
jgi:hypothetical protein